MWPGYFGIKNDHEYPLGCILPFRQGSKELIIRTFIPWIDAKRKFAFLPQWSLIHPLHHPQDGSIISNRRRVRGNFHEWKRGPNILHHLTRTRPPVTIYLDPLWQHNGIRNFKWLIQKSTRTFNGNAILLHMQPSEEWILWCEMESWTRELGQLHTQASRKKTS